MHKVYILSAHSRFARKIIDNLQKDSIECSRVDSVHELKKRAAKEKPALIFVADNLKEKQIEPLLAALRRAPEIGDTPLIGIASSSNGKDTTLRFLRAGSVDALHEDVLPEEAVLRARLRIDEAMLRAALTPNEFFFSEAQEKEQGKRSGIFHFFNRQRLAVGSVQVKEGRVVQATYGSIIKEDAFLQLACNDTLSFRFEDRPDIPEGTFSASITNLLLEAYKLKDEMKKQDPAVVSELKALIIDPNRIERLLANRALKNMGIESRVVSDSDFTLRLMSAFSPGFLIVDCTCAQAVLDRVWPEGRRQEDIPVIIYCDQEIKNLNSNSIGKHHIEKMVWKRDFHSQMKTLVHRLFNTAPVKHEEV